ncbi:hypothetical protein GOX01_15010 [Gluconobacter oxydans]|nr:hypothetical protein GOX01_15010 [Gluconobacter oxydans]
MSRMGRVDDNRRIFERQSQRGAVRKVCDPHGLTGFCDVGREIALAAHDGNDLLAFSQKRAAERGS